MRPSASFSSLLRASMKMTLRSPGILIGSLLTPVIILIGFSIINPTRIQGGPVKLAVPQETKVGAADVLAALSQSAQFKIRTYQSVADALAAVRKGEQEAALFKNTASSAAGWQYVFDDTSVRVGRIVQALDGLVRQEAGRLATSDESATLRAVMGISPAGFHGSQRGFTDFLFPGAIIVGLLGIAFFSVPVVVARYRDSGVIRRLLVTPLNPRTFATADVVSRVMLGLGQIAITVFVAVRFLHVQMKGSILWLLVLLIVALVTYLSLGYVIAGLVRSAEAASTTASVILVTLVVFSDTVFRTAQISPIGRRLFEYLPVTPLVNILRNLTLDGQTPSIGSDLVIAIAWLVVAIVGASFVFGTRQLFAAESRA